jgi:nitroreductase
MPSNTLNTQSLIEETSSQAELHPLIAQRRTRRAFSSRLIEPDTLRILFEAARWTPSSMNEQPWSFIVSTRQNQSEFERMLGCLMDFNVPWAQHAPILTLAVAKLNFAVNGQPNRHAFYDVGQAMAALTYQAIASGLNVCQMAGFDVHKAHSVFSIPADHEPVVAAAIGYQGDSATLSEKLQQKEKAPRRRSSLEQFVFENKWGQPADLIK